MSATGGANEDRPRSTIDERALAHQAYEAWEKKAALWDKMMRLRGTWGLLGWYRPSKPLLHASSPGDRCFRSRLGANLLLPFPRLVSFRRS